jgi:aryl-alcohol dehydrogenase-like predicted oxidoreductase
VSLRQACEVTLKRLRLDRIDLYQLHGRDHQVPSRGIDRGPNAATGRGGSVRHIGIYREARSRARRRPSVRHGEPHGNTRSGRFWRGC